MSNTLQNLQFVVKEEKQEKDYLDYLHPQSIFITSVGYPLTYRQMIEKNPEVVPFEEVNLKFVTKSDGMYDKTVPYVSFLDPHEDREEINKYINWDRGRQTNSNKWVEKCKTHYPWLDPKEEKQAVIFLNKQRRIKNCALMWIRIQDAQTGEATPKHHPCREPGCPYCDQYYGRKTQSKFVTAKREGAKIIECTNEERKKLVRKYGKEKVCAVHTQDNTIVMAIDTEDDLEYEELSITDERLDWKNLKPQQGKRPSGSLGKPKEELEAKKKAEEEKKEAEKDKEEEKPKGKGVVVRDSQGNEIIAYGCDFRNVSLDPPGCRPEDKNKVKVMRIEYGPATKEQNQEIDSKIKSHIPSVGLPTRGCEADVLQVALNERATFTLNLMKEMNIPVKYKKWVEVSFEPDLVEWQQQKLPKDYTDKDLEMKGWKRAEYNGHIVIDIRPIPEVITEAYLNTLPDGGSWHQTEYEENVLGCKSPLLGGDWGLERANPDGFDDYYELTKIKLAERQQKAQ